MAKKRKSLNVLVRVYADTDPELYSWLTALDQSRLAHGEKAQQIRATLLTGLHGGSGTAAAAVTAQIDLEGLGDQLLSQMRPVVEAAVASALQGLQLTMGVVPPHTDPPDDTFADTILENLLWEGNGNDQ